MARDFVDQNSTLLDAYGACCTGNDIDPNHADKDVRKKADPKGNKVETMEEQLEKIAGGELCGLSGSDRMKFWEFFALLFMAWRGQYYYVKSGGKQYTLVVMSFTAANFCQDNPNRNVLENKHIQILTLTHSQVQMYMMPNRKNYPPPVVVELDRHLQILLDKLDGKLLPDGETRVVASGMTTYFQQRAKLLTRDGNAIDDPTTEAWKVFHEDENKLTSEQRALLEKDHSYKIMKAWKEYHANGGDITKLSDEKREFLTNHPYWKLHDKAFTTHLKTIEQMKKDKSNYVQVGEEEVFYIPDNDTTNVLYQYVLKLRHLDKDNWQRLKFEQAAGISLSKMEEAYNQISRSSHQNQADEVFSGTDKSNAEESYELINQFFSSNKNEQEVRWKSFAERHRNDQRYHLLAEIREKRAGEKKKVVALLEEQRKCAHCGNEKKKGGFLIDEWNKDGDRQCKVCQSKSLARRQREEQIQQQLFVYQRQISIQQEQQRLLLQRQQLFFQQQQPSPTQQQLDPLLIQQALADFKRMTGKEYGGDQV